MTVKPGFVYTRMTEGMLALPKLLNIYTRTMLLMLFTAGFAKKKNTLFM